ncbi:MAG: hypothetical protein COA57_13240 [Flavobacteriales bacterium]|nr:MAG: hypothetical protein COA57_13240 [Flavobacteriales bacterium]
MTNFKPYLPHFAAIGVFIIVTAIYFLPLFQGKTIEQADIKHFKGMSKEVADWREKTGEEALWTNSMFSGMPAYQISVKDKGNLFQHIGKIIRLGIPTPASLIFLCFLGFYILMCCLKVDPWIGLVGALAFGFSSYFIIVVEAGHNSKAHAIAYMAPLIGSVIYAYRGKLLLGSVFTAFFLALQLNANHLQITYYTLLTLLIYGIFKLYDCWKKGELNYFFKTTGVLIAFALLAIGTNTTTLWTTYEYGKHTIRGESELTIDGIANKTSGLDRSYATAWSYGIGETMSLLIPNFKGGGSGIIGDDKEILKNIPANFRQPVANSDHYWGDQPFTSGPVYAGAIVCFLFIIGLFIVQGPLRWAMLAAAIFSIMLAWGKNFMPLTNFFLDYFPFYNKFRSVSMILVIAELAFPVLGFIALNEILKKPEILKEKKKQFFIAFGLTGGLALLYWLIPDTLLSFQKTNEFEQLFSRYKSSGVDASDQELSAYLHNLLPVVEKARIVIFKADAIRSFLFILFAAGLLWLYSKKTVKRKVLIGGMLVLVLADLCAVNLRYLNHKENYVRKRNMDVPYQMKAVDQQIRSDNDPHFRVFNLISRLDQDSRTAYFHKSLGGYHGAKLKRYQELIDFYLGKNLMGMQRLMASPQGQVAVLSYLKSQHVTNMLNAKYVMYNLNAPPLQNPYALGNAWFVDEYKFVANADSEITALATFDPAKMAIVDQRFSDHVSGFQPQKDPSAKITLTEYRPNHLSYEYSANSDQLAIFSEIYYDKGWNAYVDGELMPHIRVNYVLRGMRLPLGEHKLEFKFEPVSYYAGKNISMAASIVLILLVLSVFLKEAKSIFKPNA